MSQSESHSVERLRIRMELLSARQNMTVFAALVLRLGLNTTQAVAVINGTAVETHELASDLSDIDIDDLSESYLKVVHNLEDESQRTDERSVAGMDKGE